MIPGVGIFFKRSQLDNPITFLLVVVISVLITRGAILFFDLFDPLFPGASLVSQALVLAVGLVITGQFILRRAALRARLGDNAYAIGFRWLVVPGLTFVAVGFAHFAWIEGDPILPGELKLVLFTYLLLSGFLLWIRALHVFGLDSLTMVYVYYPEEGRMMHSDIYSVIRHPIYSAVIRFCLALAIWNGSVFALFGALMAPLAMTLWVRYGEEPELIERFGEGYRTYRAHTPAFFNFNPRTWPILWKFALLGR